MCLGTGGLAFATHFFGIITFDYMMLPFVLCHLLTAVFAHITFRYYRKKYESRLKWGPPSAAMPR